MIWSDFSLMLKEYKDRIWRVYVKDNCSYMKAVIVDAVPVNGKWLIGFEHIHGNCAQSGNIDYYFLDDILLEYFKNDGKMRESNEHYC